MARRQDRKVIKIEAAYGSDRQTFIVKRHYDLRVRDVQEDAAKSFRMPVDQIILYWKVMKRFALVCTIDVDIFREEIFVKHQTNCWRR